MASNGTSSGMEEKHFGYADTRSDREVNNTDATSDFINVEAGRPSAKAMQNTLNIDPSDKGVSELDNESKLSLEEKTTLGTDTVVVQKRPGYQTLVAAVDSDNEDNDSEVLVHEKVPDPNFDDNMPQTVTLLRTPEGGKCYLVGTAHFSLESQEDVSKVIQAVQPHIIMVELCLDRIHVLQLDEETILKEAKEITFSKIIDSIKQNGTYKGLFYILLLNLSAHLTRALGLAPGGEFRRAFHESKKIPNCLLQMGDRPIKITFARALSALSWWQTLKLVWQLLTEKEPMSRKDVERFKSRDCLEEMMAELAGEYPAVGDVFVKERDIFLTYSLQMACKPRIGEDGKPIPSRVVGVVGIGHTIGIVEHWGKVKRSQIPPILQIPSPSLSSRILKFTVKASILGTVAYVGYKLVKVTPGVLHTIKSSVEGLVKVSASQ